MKWYKQISVLKRLFWLLWENGLEKDKGKHMETKHEADAVTHVKGEGGLG